MHFLTETEDPGLDFLLRSEILGH